MVLRQPAVAANRVGGHVAGWELASDQRARVLGCSGGLGVRRTGTILAALVVAGLPLVAWTPVTPAHATVPVAYAPGTSSVVAAGGAHSLVLKSDATVWAWGQNTSGQLGNNATVGSNLPVGVVKIDGTPLDNITAVGAGRFHSLAIAADTTVWAWGSGGWGELGSNTTAQRPAAAQVLTNAGTALTNVVAVAGGLQYSVALRSDGTVWTWGRNDLGQLGVNGIPNSLVAVPANIDNVVAISAGYLHALAVKADNTVWAWGSNDLGQLGNTGVSGMSSTPVQVRMNDGSAFTDAVLVAGGAGHSLATRGDGTVWAWGYNGDGQLGDGTTTDRTGAVQVQARITSAPLGDIVALAAGDGHSLAATDAAQSGLVYGWGANAFGQVGRRMAWESAGRRPYAFPVLEADGREETGQGLSGGARHSVIGTKLATVKAMGDNTDGQLGIGSYTTPSAGRSAIFGVVAFPESDELLGDANPSEMSVTCRTSWGVNCATGNYSVSVQDLYVPGRSVPLAFRRTYNSRLFIRDSSKALSELWSHNYGMMLRLGAGEAKVIQENGSAAYFFQDASGAFLAPSRTLATLTREADQTLVFKRHRDQLKFRFSAVATTGSDAFHQLISITDRNGYVTSLDYADEKLMAVRDPDQRSLTFAYHTDPAKGGRLASVTDPAGHSVGFDYSGADPNLASVTDVNNGVTTYGYDSSFSDPPHLVSIIDPKQQETRNDYDCTTTCTISATRRLSYNFRGATTVIADGRGNSVMARHRSNVLVSLTRGYGSDNEATWSFRPDLQTLGAASTVDPNGHVSERKFNPRGGLKSVTNALGHEHSYTYNSFEEVLTATDALGATTTFTYDANGNVLTRSRPLVGSSPLRTRLEQFFYDDTNHRQAITRIIDARGKTWTFTYNPVGYLASATDPLAHKTTYSYDNAAGWMTSMTYPKGNVTGVDPVLHTVTYGHDPDGLVTFVRDPLWLATKPTAHQTLRSYDPNRNLASVTDGRNHTTEYVYNEFDELIRTERPDGSVLRTAYDVAGNVVKHIDGKQAVTVYDYDALNRVKSVTDPLLRLTRYSYDGVGNVVTKAAPGGTCTASPNSGCTAYTYDEADQLVGIDYSEPTTPDVTSITYDANGRRRTMVDGSGTSTWKWDSLYRLTKHISGAGNTMLYDHDLAGLVTAITYPGTGRVANRTYDGTGRLKTVTDWLANQTKFAYDVNSNLKTITFPAATGLVDTFTYDRAGHMRTAGFAKGGVDVASYTYSRDDASDVASVAGVSLTGVLGESHTYDYTDTGQLQRVDTGQYAYDPADNMVAFPSGASQLFDAANQLCWSVPGALQATPSCGAAPAGATTFAHDNRGNRIQVTKPGGTQTNLGYDQADRLVSYGTTATYAYNGDGLRSKKVVSGTTTDFTWDHSVGLPLLAREGTTSIVYGVGGQPLARITDAGVVRHFHHDQSGSVRALTGPSGEVLNTYAYDAQGNVVGATGTAANSFGFAGQYTDAESGYQYLRARYYDPVTAQFLSRDPVVATTRQAYSYACNNPLNASDPSGLHCSAGAQAGGAGASAVRAVPWEANSGPAGARPADSAGECDPGTPEPTAPNMARAVGDDLLHPGPWARESVPASSTGRATAAQQAELNRIGDAYGCHSCGAPTSGVKSGNWIGDHQPVTRTVPSGTPQVLYPHCQICSNEQGLWIINLIRQGRL